jgi:ADP-ribose pyrophosphatase YjhB (NUDIX family)
MTGTSAGGPVRLEVDTGPPGGRTVRRDAVRALAVDSDGRVLLLSESRGCGLKFPGGGVREGEPDGTALAREVREETGYAVTGVGRLAVVVAERRPGIEPGVVLEMESRYYAVELGAAGETALEADEAELGLAAVWLPLEEALRRQREHVGDDPQPWAQRELAVLVELDRQARD